MDNNQKVTKGNGSNPFVIVLIIIAGILAWVYFDKHSFDLFVAKLIDSAVGVLCLALIIFAIAFILRNSFKKFW